MSGLAGLYYPVSKPVDPARVAAMADAMAHRGPDGSGIWTAHGVGLGHRRLSIIDLEGGAQPMLTPEQDLAVVFNGEIYNFQQLRIELEEKGARFQTHSDTEVLLHGWRAWGPAMLERLNGMFAFALYDLRDQSLFLARDRFGVKPLHYVELSDGAIGFASELKGLMAHPLLARRADFHAVDDFLGLGYVPDDACLVAGVKKLPAGHWLRLERGRSVPEPQRWWELDFSQRAKGSRRDLEAELLHRMRDAIRLRMIADVPLGAFLSGGVDSSAVVAIMAGESRRAVKTCTIGFAEAGQDETEYAQIVAERFRTDQRTGSVTADNFALIDTLVAAFDEPFADPSALATYHLCELARETVTVALSGIGADEALAGYRRYRIFAGEERVRRLLPHGMRTSVFGRLGRVYPQADWAPRMFRAKTSLLALAEGGEFAYAKAVGVTTPGGRARLYTDRARAALDGHNAEQRYVDAMRQAPARNALDRAQFADFRHWLPGNILAKMDRTSMAVSLETREPLLDHRLVQFAATLPVTMRIKHGQGKWLMKRALAAHLPRKILYRAKMEFATPVSVWFRGALADDAAALARAPMLGDTGWFDRAAIARIAADHRAGRADYGGTLWQLLMLEKSLKRLFG